MGTRYDIVCIGAATRDVFLHLPGGLTRRTRRSVTGAEIAVPLGSKIDLSRVTFETGGGATNAAVAFARLGWRSAFVGRVGDDERGRIVLAEVKREGVAISDVVRDASRQTGYSAHLLTPSGERTALVHRGASAAFRASELKPRSFSAPWIYASSLSGSAPALRQLFAIAARRHINVAFNPGNRELAWGLKRLRPFLSQAAIVFLNRQEASQLLQTHEQDERRLLHELCFALPGIVVITQGQHGAIACDDRRQYTSSTHHVSIRNTNGAGDAFGSGFTWGYVTSRGDVSFALQAGTANAESVIQSVGAKPGLLHRIPGRHLVRVRVSRPSTVA